MKKIIYLLLTGLIASCSTAEHKLTLTNTSDLDRKDAGIVLSHSDLETILPGDQDMLPVLKDSDGVFIPTQVDDLDGDGKWDEFFLLTDLKPREIKKFTIAFVPEKDYPAFTVRTNIRFAKKDEDYKEMTFATREIHATNTITQQVWQMEGIAWENDKIGFRNYFDRRNGIDIFGKVNSDMVLDQVGYKNNPSYHDFNPEWGVDVLKVGNSLGAGSIAYNYKDSLYRVGDNGVGTCRILTEGPLRSIFRLEFTDWKVKGWPLNVIHDISIEAGKYYFESKVSYTGTDEALQLVTGIVNMKSKDLFKAATNEQYVGFYTYDVQAEDTTRLGMGLLVTAKDFIETSETPEEGNGIIETYCVHLKTSVNSPGSYRFYTVWERESSQWKKAEGFEDLLITEADLMANPVTWKLK